MTVCLYLNFLVAAAMAVCLCPDFLVAIVSPIRGLVFILMCITVLVQICCWRAAVCTSRNLLVKEVILPATITPTFTTSLAILTIT